MSRREEVDKKINYMLDAPAHQIEECLEESFALARTLADEVDALTAERDSLARRINPDGAPVDVADLCLEIDTVTDEVAALTAERDELKRRVEAVCEYAAHNKRNQRFIAIAEGLENG